MEYFTTYSVLTFPAFATPWYSTWLLATILPIGSGISICYRISIIESKLLFIKFDELIEWISLEMFYRGTYVIFDDFRKSCKLLLLLFKF